MTAPYYVDAGVTIFHGDCLDVMRELPDASVDAVVTDPPYGLEFMGKDWDAPWQKTDSWRNGSGITRTGYTDTERLARPSFTGDTSNPTCAICGGRKRGARRCECVTPDWRVKGKPLGNPQLQQLRAFGAWCELWAAECLRVLKPGGHLLAFGGTRTYHRLACAVEDVGFEIRDSISWLYGSGFPKSLDVSKAIDKAAVTLTAPATPLAEQWQGWGTALKPAHEPIVVARKPLAGTVAANVAVHGTGALNIDGCRVATSDKLGGGHSTNGQQMADGWHRPWMDNPEAVEANKARSRESVARSEALGRWPTNVLLDQSQADALDAETGVLTSGLMRAGITPRGERNTYGKDAAGGYTREADTYADSGGASRFFPTFRYQAKAPKAERPRDGDTVHPTVKPLTLMRWLVRLVTPPGGTVLDPFLGSGTTAEACVLEGFRCIGIEREVDYLPLIVARLDRTHHHKERPCPT